MLLFFFVRVKKKLRIRADLWFCKQCSIPLFALSVKKKSKTRSAHGKHLKDSISSAHCTCLLQLIVPQSISRPLECEEDLGILHVHHFKRNVSVSCNFQHIRKNSNLLTTLMPSCGFKLSKAQIDQPSSLTVCPGLLAEAP